MSKQMRKLTSRDIQTIYEFDYELSNALVHTTREHIDLSDLRVELLNSLMPTLGNNINFDEIK